MPATASPPSAEAFERTMIRNIATVPFVEMFDLLRSAPPKMRLAWIKQLAEMPKGPTRTVALSGFYKTFVQLDPKAAAESIETLHDENAKWIAAEAMTGAVPLSAMGEIAAMLARLPPGFFPRGSPDYLWNAMFDWSAVNPSAAAEFLKQNPKVSEHYAGALLLSWARLDPEQALRWLERQPANVKTEWTVSSLIDGWFGHDESGAIAFTLAHASDEKFKRSVSDMAIVLTRRSPDEAREFLLRLPNDARNAALHEIGMVMTSREYVPKREYERPAEEIARWMITLPKESWRGGDLKWVLDNWESQNEPGLLAWMNQLPVDARDEILSIYCVSAKLEKAVPLLLTISDPKLRDKTMLEYIAQSLPPSRERALLMIGKSGLSEAQKKYVIGLLPLEETRE